MSGVVANPDDLERFAQALKKYTSDLNSSSTQLNSEFRRLGGTWRDQEYAKFAQEYERTMRVIKQFMVEADKEVTLLQRKAALLREFLNKR